MGTVYKMSNLERYEEAYVKGLEIENRSEIKYLERGKAANWDSVGHMTLITQLEDDFDIMFDAEDIIDFSSFEKGIDILKKYGVEI